MHSATYTKYILLLLIDFYIFAFIANSRFLFSQIINVLKLSFCYLNVVSLKINLSNLNCTAVKFTAAIFGFKI